MEHFLLQSFSTLRVMSDNVPTTLEHFQVKNKRKENFTKKIILSGERVQVVFEKFSLEGTPPE